jgi:hypothetical protein
MQSVEQSPAKLSDKDRFLQTHKSDFVNTQELRKKVTSPSNPIPQPVPSSTITQPISQNTNNNEHIDIKTSKIGRNYVCDHCQQCDEFVPSKNPATCESCKCDLIFHLVRKAVELHRDCIGDFWWTRGMFGKIFCCCGVEATSKESVYSIVL